MSPHHHYSGCGHNTTPTQPPNPGGNTRASVSINQYIPLLFILAIIFILMYKIIKYKPRK